MRLIKVLITGMAVASLWLHTASLHAQSPAVKAFLDSTYVIIGSPTTIHLEAILPDHHQIQFPAYQSGAMIPVADDTAEFFLEVAGQPQIDTLSASNGMLTLRQDIRVFAFDSASLFIPPFPLVLDGDTVYTNALALKVVVPFDVVVDPQQYADIKGPLEPAFVLLDYAEWFFFLVGILLLGAAAYGGYLYYKKRSLKKDGGAVPVAIMLSPYEEAMQALTRLDEKKLWQQGLSKQFYTELVDILRVYVERRFGVSAMEKTSYEILAEMRRADGVTQSSMQNLKQVLTLSDLVKFAKCVPLPDDNHLSFMNVKMFVSQTVEEKCLDTSSVVAPIDEQAGEQGNTIVKQ